MAKQKTKLVLITATMTLAAIAVALFAACELDRPEQAPIYDIVYHRNGGARDMDNSTHVYDEPKNLNPNNFVRDGYIFTGWARTPDGNVEFADGENVVNLTDKNGDVINLYAQWRAISFTVAYDKNGGVDGPEGPMPPSTFTYGTEQALRANTFTNPDYVFHGWSRNSGTQQVEFANSERVSNLTTVDGATVTLYAQWGANVYFVNYDSNGGVNGPDGPMPLSSFTHGVQATLPANTFTRSGFTFTGWAKTPSGSVEFAPGANVTSLANAGETVTLFAQWQGISYTVAYDINGGDSGTMTPSNFIYGTPQALRKNAFNRTGNKFIGWSRTETAAVEFADEEVVSNLTATAGAAVTLFAKWEPAFTVDFNANGGEPTPPVQLIIIGDSGAKVTQPAVIKTGYTLEGWYTNSAFTGSKWDFANDTVADAMTLYANWVAAKYTVNFEVNGGTPEPSPLTNVNHGAPIADPSALTTITRTGYTFDGWYSNGSFTTDKWNFASDTVTGNMTLYAKWISNKHTVTFVWNGGIPTPADPTIEVNHGGKVPQPAMIKEGHAFGGWFINSDFTGSAWDFANDTVVTGDITLHAKWTIHTYTVQFYANGGTPAPENLPSVTHGTIIDEPVIAKEGNGLDGWYRNSAFTGSKWNFADPVTGNMTLYAKWNPAQYTVRFVANGGTPAPDDFTNVAHDTTITAPGAMTKTGHTFDAWYKEPEFATKWIFASDKVTSDITLYANWTPNKYTVTFNTMGGTPAISPLANVSYGTTIDAPLPGATSKIGFAFDGWYKDSGLTELWLFAFDLVTGPMTLYAKWVDAEYTVYFEANGGTPQPNSIPVGHGAIIDPPPAMINGTFAFDGWYRNSSFTGSAWNFLTNTVTDTMTLYAKWVPTYPVTFIANGGYPEPVNLPNVKQGEKITAPPAMTKANHNFDGWYKDIGFTEAWDFTNDTVTGPITLYAEWIAEYFVAYDANGGQGAVMAPSTFNYGTPGNLRKNTFTRIGYVFAGWSRTATGTVEFDDEGEVLNLTATAGATVILYAVWGDASIVVEGDLPTLSSKLDKLFSTGYVQSGYEYLLEVHTDEVIDRKDSLSSDTLKKSNVNIRLKGIGSMRNVSLSSTTAGSMFTVGDGITLILDENITLQGKSTINAALVTVSSGGTFIMKTGSAITGNTGDRTQPSKGGGVYVAGTFTMDGGTIYDNSITSATTANCRGGGVYVNGGTFTMNDGAISNNTVENNIGSSANIQTINAYGGGVYVVGTNGSFSMYGGTISNNTVIAKNTSTSTLTSYVANAYGGGVSVENYTTFTMHGGTISGNNLIAQKTTTDNSNCRGGGVYVNSSGSFIMNGGTISGNTLNATKGTDVATFNRGGGVYVDGTFTMSGGIISGHNLYGTNSYGGGVWVGNTFTKTGGGTIYGNDYNVGNNNTVETATEHGHAVYGGAASLVRWRDGTIGPSNDLTYSRTAGASTGPWSY